MTPRLDDFRNAVARLRDGLTEVETALVRDACIQRFEFCFELAWKCIQEAGRDAGLDCRSPKACLKLAFRQGWLDDEQGWLAALDGRSLSSHTYSEPIAKEVYQRLPTYLPLFERLVARLTAIGS